MPVDKYQPYELPIMGMQWVPIRDEDLAFSPAVFDFEQGHVFTVDTGNSPVIQNALFFARDIPEFTGQVIGANIYRFGSEQRSGPIQSIIIPCSAGGITGSSITAVGASTVAEAVSYPGDGKYLQFTSQGSTSVVNFFFATATAIVAPLNLKRILGVNILYIASGAINSGPADIYMPVDPSLRGDPATPSVPISRRGFVGTGQVLDSAISSVQMVGSQRRMKLGSAAFWTPTQTPATTSVRNPHSTATLNLFDASAAANRVSLRLSYDGTPAAVAERATLSYLAMEVVYCDERRIIYGGRQFGSSPAYTVQPYVTQTNVIPMVLAGAQTANPSLGDARYLLTVGAIDTGHITVSGSSSFPITDSPYPNLNALRQLYELPTIPGRKVAIPFPPEERIGETFDSVPTDVLVQVTLETGTTTVTGFAPVHPYGRQGAAQIYGNEVATQDVENDPAPLAAPAVYPQVRYYARRHGDTTVPLLLRGVGAYIGSQATISPGEYDALPEIVDGWKEITLRFGTAPDLSTAGTSQWTWSATGENASDRWDVLAACAPAISGTPGNRYNLVTTNRRLSPETYGGASQLLLWLPQGVASPFVSTGSNDPGCDAVILFSMDPPTVTGVAISQQSQTVTGIGLDCGSLPCCIPSGIGYNRITWPFPPNTSYARDSFTRTVAAGSWGSADIGGAYTLTGTATDFSVNGSSGRIAIAAAGPQTDYATLPVGTDFDVTATVGTVSTPTGVTGINFGVTGRFASSVSNWVAYFVNDLNQLILARNGGSTILCTVNLDFTCDNGAQLKIRFAGKGQSLWVKAWPANDAEPDVWQINSYYDNGGPTSGTGAGAFLGITASTTTVSYDDLLITPPRVYFGGYELQRLDTVTSTFETIMLASSPHVTGFNDYEARVGINSVYRIRQLNILNFAGAWSTQVTGAPPTPGVTGGCSGDGYQPTLIFTSNAAQNGGANAAYVPQWDGEPIEDFQLPEAGMVTLQPMYNRDGYVAFHGTERGLEQFTRVLLVQAGAISPERLADVKQLRDLAWADLPYVCVRDDIGDRWYSNVQVPVVSARALRTKYFATVQVTELTECPYAVDPDPL